MLLLITKNPEGYLTIPVDRIAKGPRPEAYVAHWMSYTGPCSARCARIARGRYYDYDLVTETRARALFDMDIYCVKCGT
jgi:hypothetical protein